MHLVRNGLILESKAEQGLGGSDSLPQMVKK